MNRILFLLVILFFLACSPKEEFTFSLQGQIENPANDYLILHQETDIERQISKLVDTIYLDASGKFKANFKTPPDYYTLTINAGDKLPLAIDKDQTINLEIAGNTQKITGSKDTDLLMEYEHLRKQSLERLVTSIRKEISAENKSENPSPIKIDSLGKLELKNYGLHLEELKTFIKDEMGTSIALYPTSLRWKGEENLAFYDSLVNKFEASHPDLNVSKKLREKISRLKQTSIGGKVPGIVMNSANNTTFSLYSVNKKYTLIDFWASWCGPCRRESEVLSGLYKKYKSKGFVIYGVSLDTDEKQWLNAMEKDKRNWINVSSLRGFKSPAAYKYAVSALPMNYIIDNKGIIIAKDLHGEELQKMIDKLMTQ